MKNQKLTIKINKPVKDVFAFAVNPDNTPRWINSIVTEEANEWPPGLGTIYRNQDTAGEWRELEITDFEQDKMFVLSDKNGFHIQYRFIPLDKNSTELQFYIWVDSGELKNTFTMEILERLKQVIESSRLI